MTHAPRIPEHIPREKAEKRSNSLLSIPQNDVSRYHSGLGMRQKKNVENVLKMSKFQGRKQRLRAVLWVCVLLLPCAQSVAGEGMDRLQAFFSEKGAMRAQFVQTVQGAAFAQPGESSGVLTMQRPGKFRWDYQKPYQQQIIADGKNLWIFDVDLDQVVVKPMDEALGDTPALLLSGDGSVSERFDIKELADLEGNGREGDLLWVQLSPKQTDTGFQQMRLGFGERHLLKMELVDGFGQTTTMTFSNIEKGLELPADTFRFVPPEGVDVIGQKAGER
jgi:outer membrane lipoprotein carrier protein